LNSAIDLQSSARGAAERPRYTWEASKALLTTIEQNVSSKSDRARAVDTARARSLRRGRVVSWPRRPRRGKKKFDNGMTTSFQVTQIRAISRRAHQRATGLAVYRKACDLHYAIDRHPRLEKIRIEGIPESILPPTRGRDAIDGTEATARPADARPERCRAWRRLFSPVATFRSIAQRPTWLAPLLLWVALRDITTVLMRGSMGKTIRARMRRADRRFPKSGSLHRRRRTDGRSLRRDCLRDAGVIGSVAAVLLGHSRPFGSDLTFRPVLRRDYARIPSGILGSLLLIPVLLRGRA